MSLVAGDIGGARTVKGAPYCADAVHESVQWLPDGSGGVGNRIVRQQTSRLCRDGEGRTRQEIERGGRKLVYLRDPLSRENWVLDTERKTARRLASAGTPGFEGIDAGGMRDFAERMRDWARQMADRARGNADPIAWPAMPAPPTPPTHTSPGAAPAAPLPARDIEGLRAHGERTSWVIAAGQVGNEKPIEITREVWTSPELMLTLSSRDFDPRSGEISYRLKGLKRGEPDAALMRVPADFSRPARPSGRASTPTG